MPSNGNNFNKCLTDEKKSEKGDLTKFEAKIKWLKLNTSMMD